MLCMRHQASSQLELCVMPSWHFSSKPRLQYALAYQVRPGAIIA